jgi:hypothetical protein
LTRDRRSPKVAGVPANVYHFVSRWRVRGTLEEVWAILQDLPALPRWWPSVYLEVEETAPGDAAGVGRSARLRTRGRLPYTLSWGLTITEARRPHGFSLTATGDFEGTGVWRFNQQGDWVDITYDWNIRADKPLIRRLSFLLKPLFAANHRWAMARGEESLAAELRRRRAGPHPGAPVR